MKRSVAILVLGCSIAVGRGKAEGGSDQSDTLRQHIAAVKAALDGVPEVAKDAEPLRTAAVDAYLKKMHRQIHKLWGAGAIEDWDALKSDSPLNNPALVTVLEIILNGDGSVDKIAVDRRSGYLPYDAAAVDAAFVAGPYPPLPVGIRSANGKGYVRWAFHRDRRQCSTPFVSFFMLRSSERPQAGPSAITPGR